MEGINPQALKDLAEQMSDADKKRVIDEVNALPEDADAPSGNTVISTLADDEELRKQIESLSPRELYDQNVGSNFRSCFKLQEILPKLSKKNLIKVLIATIKLPEQGAVLKFGGTPEQIKQAEWAFIQSQVAANTKTYITSIDAAAKARYEKLQKQKESEAQSEEEKEKE